MRASRPLGTQKQSSLWAQTRVLYTPCHQWADSMGWRYVWPTLMWRYINVAMLVAMWLRMYVR